MRYETTALRIREAMSDMGISQQELANRSGIGKSSISHYINGFNEPGNKSAYALSMVLGVNPSWLMGLNVPKHTAPEQKTENYSKQFADRLSKYSPEEIEKAMKIIELYENATPEGRAVFETLLKLSQQNP